MKGLPSGPFTLPVIVAPNAGDAKETVNAKETSTLSIERMTPPGGPLLCASEPLFIVIATGSRANYNESSLKLSIKPQKTAIGFSGALHIKSGLATVGAVYFLR